MVCGLILQVLSIGSVAVLMWRNIRNQGIGRHITAEMIKLAWRSELHTRSGLIVLIAGSVVYAVGSVLIARPYISNPIALFVAVPIAAVVGILVLGVLVLAIGWLFTLLVDMQAGDPGGVSDPARRAGRVLRDQAPGLFTSPADTEPENEPPEGQPDRRA